MNYSEFAAACERYMEFLMIMEPLEMPRPIRHYCQVILIFRCVLKQDPDAKPHRGLGEDVNHSEFLDACLKYRDWIPTNHDLSRHGPSHDTHLSEVISTLRNLIRDRDLEEDMS